MDDKTYNGPVSPYNANPPHPPPGPGSGSGNAVPLMHTGSYESSPPAVAHQSSYTQHQGVPPSHSPTQYPHQPIAPLDNPPHYASQPPPGSPPPQSQISQAPPLHSSAAMASSPGQEKHEYYSTTNQPQQAGIPLQTQAGGMPPQQQQGMGYAQPAMNVYHTVTPLASLSIAPAPVDCPVCHTRALTRVEQHSGNTTHAWAAVVCCLTGCGCIPYLIRGLKDTEHYCGHCGVLLATYHNSGHTVVHQHG